MLRSRNKHAYSQPIVDEHKRISSAKQTRLSISSTILLSQSLLGILKHIFELVAFFQPSFDGDSRWNLDTDIQPLVHPRLLVKGFRLIKATGLNEDGRRKGFL